MPKRYSPEIKRTALELVNQGQTQIEVAQALGVSPKTLSVARQHKVPTNRQPK